MNVLITGGAGFVGSYLAAAELKRGNKVVILDIAPPDKIKELLPDKNLKYVRGDFTDPKILEPLVKKCDLFYHFAAIADPKIYCEDPLKVLRVDLEGSQLAIKLAFKHNKKLVFSSTSEVYGKNPNVPWKEDSDRVLGSTVFSRWSYSSAKAVGEHYCFAYGKKGFRFVILRFFNFYGPKLDAIGQGRVMTCFLEKFLKNKPVEVTSPGTQTRCFTYIDDGIEGVLKAAHSKKAEGKAFNLGRPVETTMLELAKTMKKIGCFKSKIKLVPGKKIYGEGYEDINRRVPDVTRAKKLLNWEAKTTLEEGLKKIINHFCQKP